MAYNQGGGNNQAVGALIYVGSMNQTIKSLVAYVVQLGAAIGSFQMAILMPTSISQAMVIAVTPIVNAITPGLFTLPLSSPMLLPPDSVFYLAVYNQVNGSQGCTVPNFTNKATPLTIYTPSSISPDCIISYSIRHKEYAVFIRTASKLITEARIAQACQTIDSGL
jgi:hypothetical protein